MIEKLRMTSIRLRPLALTTLRVVVGVVMVVHGWLKLTDYQSWLNNAQQMGIWWPEVMAPMAIAGELVGGLGLLIGFLTPIAAAGVLSVMLTAIITVHIGNGLLAQDGGFEYPMIVAATALFFIVRGGGPISVDRLVFGRRAREEDLGRRRRQRRLGREAHA